MLIGLLSVFFAAAAAIEEPRPPRDEKPREVSWEVVDPFDSRHLELTVYLDPGKVSVQKVEVRPGVARAYLADSSRLRLRLLDARGGVLQESGVPNPLSLRVYIRQGDGSIHPVSSVEGPSANPRPHDTEDLDEAAESIVLPLLPELTTVSLGWIDVGLVDQDVRTEIRDVCAKDGHPVCRAWMDKNP